VIEPLNDDAMDEAIHADPGGDVVRASQGPRQASSTVVHAGRAIKAWSLAGL
jgi:hypothetical protein